jgi:hypothetical protein
MLTGTLYSQDSNAVLTLANGAIEVDWYVGQPMPSIDLTPEPFVVIACGAELAWVYSTFPGIPVRTLSLLPGIKRIVASATPLDTVCVIWRGDHARFIADNLVVTSK